MDGLFVFVIRLIWDGWYDGARLLFVLTFTGKRGRIERWGEFW